MIWNDLQSIFGTHNCSLGYEGEGIEAKGQAGFRKDISTTDNISVLKSLIDNCLQAKADAWQVDSCFVDFKKAFGTVPENRGLLWQVLENVRRTWSNT